MSATSWIKRTVAVAVVATVGFALGAPVAEAGSVTNPFVVQTRVFGACTLATANLVFPNYTTGQVTPVNGSTGWTVTCPGASVATPLPVTFTMNPGAGGFVMAGVPAGALNYQLCNDAACGTVYGNNVAGPNINVTNPLGQAYTLYGQIAANQASPVGNYAQNVNATLTF